jgi:hypothetical protein
MTGRKPITYAGTQLNRRHFLAGLSLATLAGVGNLLALTLDDGVNSDVVRLYTQFAKDTGLRLTYFVNGTYGSWTENRGLLGRR